jgi:Ala-tRNA(Pro) deacylase
MAIAEKLQKTLDNTGTPYVHTVHEPVYTARQVARAEEIRPHQCAKAIVFFGDTGFGMLVLPADSYVDFAELAFELGLSNVRLATEAELIALFPDSEVGAMPPFGNLYGLPVYVDASLAQEDVIAFNAGTHRDAVYMRFEDFDKLAEPRITYFSRP